MRVSELSRRLLCTLEMWNPRALLRGHMTTSTGCLLVLDGFQCPADGGWQGWPSCSTQLFRSSPFSPAPCISSSCAYPILALPGDSSDAILGPCGPISLSLSLILQILLSLKPNLKRTLEKGQLRPMVEHPGVGR